MIKILGWLGFLLFISTLVLFFQRRLSPGKAARLFARHHHSLALACLGVLTLHGLWALLGRRGWGWGAWGTVPSGVIAWLVLLAAVILATSCPRELPFRRIHRWVVVLLGLLVTGHVF